MRFNESAMKQFGKQGTCDKEGRLDYKAPKEGYRQRWFRLKGNLLFYYKTNSLGCLSDSEAIGVLVLERLVIQMEPMANDRPFVFSLAFDTEKERKHYFGGQSVHMCEEWMKALQTASIECLKSKMMQLQAKIQQKSSTDPSQDFCAHLPEHAKETASHKYEGFHSHHTKKQESKVKVNTTEILLDPFSLRGWTTFE